MNFGNILFLDIETVAQYQHYEQLPDAWRELWDHKAGSLLRNNNVDTPDSIYDRAGIYAEFGKIICISVGCIVEEHDERKLVLTSYSGHDEKALLLQFVDMLNKPSNRNKQLCAHNGKEFDYPYLCRRMIINNINIPTILQIAGKKPWELVNLIDTMELWKFGDYKSYTSLKLLALTLGIPSPKDDIDGSMVYSVYYQEQDLERIVTYCQKDVATLAQVLLRYSNQHTIKPEHISVKFRPPVAIKGDLS